MACGLTRHEEDSQVRKGGLPPLPRVGWKTMRRAGASHPSLPVNLLRNNRQVKFLEVAHDWDLLLDRTCGSASRFTG